MLQITGIKTALGSEVPALRAAAARALGVKPGAIASLELRRQAIDARKKGDIHLVSTVWVTLSSGDEVRFSGRTGVSRAEAEPYRLPAPRRKSPLRPVVVGMGPAGLFAALTLARAGLKPLILERGRCVEERAEDVAHFWRTGELSVTSNVQFGEGGAGTFSDGKLTTGTHDRRVRHVLETFAAFGAPKDILWSAKPHIGTDILREVVRAMRAALCSLGAEVRFAQQLWALRAGENGLSAVTVMTETGPYDMPCDALLLAPGHSARDTFRMLYEAGVPLAQKPFAIGVRIEHDQETVSRRQYGDAWAALPPADYKLACHLPSGRSAFSFCVCPGGEVVAAASEYGQVVTNGMSFRARAGRNINGGFLVGVGPEDFGDSHPLAGMYFQEKWERAAWAAGGGAFRAPAQLVGDFLRGAPSTGPGAVKPTYRPGVTWGSLEGCLPEGVCQALREALPVLDRKLRGFADAEAVLTGIESRSSSPVRILRGTDFQSVGLQGLYPCGEGAGYAGGIVSAAVDGIKAAEALLQAE